MFRCCEILQGSSGEDDGAASFYSGRSVLLSCKNLRDICAAQQIRDNGEGMVLPKSYVGLKSHRRA